MKAILIPTDPGRSVEIVDFDGGLKALQALVGGSIETVPYPGRRDVSPYFNEEGKIRGLPANGRATTLLAGSIYPGDFIAGDCVLTGMTDMGEDVDCPLELDDVVRAAAAA